MHTHCNALLQRLRTGGLMLLMILGIMLAGGRSYGQAPVGVFAENNTPPKVICGEMDMLSGGVDEDGYRPYASAAMPPPPITFPSGAIISCGLFQVYYDDIRVHNNIGFDDPAFGAARRNTFCAVLNYIQTVFDFSGVDPGHPIRIGVDQSFGPLPGLYSTPTSPLAYAIPQYQRVPNAIIGGYINDYAVGRRDPLAGTSDYHAEVRVNFDGISWQNDWSTPFLACNMDLYSVLLHEMGHAMGFFSLVQFPLTGITSGLAPSPVLAGFNSFSLIDNTVYQGTVHPMPGVRHKLINRIGGINVLDATLACNADYWINNNDAPSNYPVFSGQIFGGIPGMVSQYISHLDDQQGIYGARSHISPGDNQEYNMGPYCYSGVLRRTYTKAEVQIYTSALHYTLTPAFAAAHPSFIPNHIPFSRKMAGYPLLMASYLLSDFIETMPADYTMTNNGPTAPPLTIRLTDPTFAGTGPTADLYDQDPADLKFIDLSTLANFRGCGSPGGNNHNQLTPIMSGTRCVGLFYRPRPDFYGRAQFGFNVNDGKETGGFRIVTIDVTQGPLFPPRPPAGGNMVINGNFESGTELKTVGAGETIPNTTVTHNNCWESRLFALSLDDGHPYCNHTMFVYPFGQGTVVRNSAATCGALTITTLPFGGDLASATSFPNLVHDYPLPVGGTGNRYQKFVPGIGIGSYYNLSKPVNRCINYTLEFDAFYPHLVLPTTIPLKVGFTNAPVPGAVYPLFNFDFNYSIITSPGGWQHISIPFWYCGSLPSTTMFLAPIFVSGTTEMLIDNLSLSANVTIPPLTVVVTQTGLAGCMTRLTAVVSDAACASHINWSTGAVTTSIDVPSNVAATYYVSVSDDCSRSAMASSVIAPGAPGPITGLTSLCAGSTIVLSDAVVGGTWVSSNPGVASIDISTGVVSGISPGTAIITYTTYCSTWVTATITVTPAPPAITGSLSVCVRDVSPLAHPSAGGTWTSNSPLVAMIGSTTGIVTGVSAGTALITYRIDVSCYLTTTVTVHPAAGIAGNNFDCVGDLVPFYGSPAGGSWISSDLTVATIDPTTGVATGVGGGWTIITYTSPDGCTATINVYFGAMPAPIGGVATICEGSTATLTDATAGGFWTTNNPLIASVNVTTGIVSGVSVGTAEISYTLPPLTTPPPLGCPVVTIVTVTPSPAPIRGTKIVCIGTTNILTAAVAGGNWNSDNPLIADVGLMTGVITGVSAGSTVITYTLPTGCTAMTTVSVIPFVPAITGPDHLCEASIINLFDAILGGTWSSPSPNVFVATVYPGIGYVAGVTAGTAVITYSFGAGCTALYTITVNPMPAPITGPSSICMGGSIVLTESRAGGTWTTSNALVGTVSPSGIVTSVGPGVTTIVYTMPGGCFVTKIITVYPMPAPITGLHTLCEFSTITLTETTAGGTWSSSNTTVATVSATGVVGGAAAGTATITYMMTGLCFQTHTITVNPMPAPITGTNSVCIGSTLTLGETRPGGAWSSNDPTVASVSPGSGIVTGISPGATTITYMMPGGCYVTLRIFVYSGSTGCVCTSLGSRPFSTLDPMGTNIISSAIPPGNYYLDHSVVITGNVVMTNAVILMKQSVSISVDPNSMLTLSGCHLYCCTFQWTGIVLLSNTSITGKVVLQSAAGMSTLIEDAERAVDVDNPRVPNGLGGITNFVTSTNTIFNRNTIGVRIAFLSTPPTASPATYPFEFQNTVFTCRGLVPYSAPFTWPTAIALHQYWDPATIDPVNGPYKAAFNINNPAAGSYLSDMCHTTHGAEVAQDGILLEKVGTGTAPVYSRMVIGTPAPVFARYGVPPEYEQNLFDHLQYGIEAHNANVLVQNCAFADGQWTGYVVGTEPLQGDGIYAYCTDGTPYKLTVQPGVSSFTLFRRTYTVTTPNKFYNCKAGVYVKDYQKVIGVGSQMTSEQTTTPQPTGEGGDGSPWTGTPCSGFVSSRYFGFNVLASDCDTINISNNTIWNIANGITVKKRLPPSPFPTTISLGDPGQTIINGNKIHVLPPASLYPTYAYGLTNHYVEFPVWVDNTIPYGRLVGAPMPSTTLTSDLNTVTDAYNGIYINGVNGQTATSNTNTINEQQYPSGGQCQQFGVYHTNCYSDQTIRNTIAGTNPDNDWWRGVKTEASSFHSVNCNNVSNVGRGFEFFNTHLASSWRGNSMTNTARGFVLNAGEIWDQGNATSPCDNSWYATGTFGWTGLRYQTFTMSGAIPTNSRLWVQSGIHTTPTVNNTDEPLTPCSLTYGCGGPNGLNPASALLGGYMGCTQAINDGTIGHTLIAQKAALFTMYQHQHDWMGQQALWQAMQLTDSLVDTSTVLMLFKALAAHSRYALLMQIEDTLARGDTAAAQNMLTHYGVDSMTNNTNDTTTGVQMADDTTADNIVLNYRRYYQLYINFLENTLSPSDKADIETMAGLCPLNNGAVVYKARALYDVVYNDQRIFENNCPDSVVADTTEMRHGRSPAHPKVEGGVAGTDGQQYVLLPNPNDGNFMLRQMVADEDAVNAEIYDVVGRSVYKDRLRFSGGKTNLRMVNGMPGMYMLRLKDSKGRMFMFKFVVE